MLSQYQLKFYPDSVLREKSFPVLNFNGRLIELIKQMKQIMYEREGIGLAAAQVGILQCVIIADIGEGLLTLVNPFILHQTGQDRREEGCLSLPGIQVDIPRNTGIKVSGLSPQGKVVEMDLNGLTARVVQHEIDHLNGVLILDYQDELIGKKKMDYMY